MSKPGLTLVEISPPLRVLQPKPASSASSTSVSRPPRAVCSAALSPVYPEPMTAQGYKFAINYIVYDMSH